MSLFRYKKNQVQYISCSRVTKESHYPYSKDYRRKERLTGIVHLTKKHEFKKIVNLNSKLLITQQTLFYVCEN